MKNRKNNKGFSLVELIVVVAIMAVLVGVLAPAYLRYVEKSRIQKDDSAIAEIVEAVKIAAAEEDCYDELTTTDQAIGTFATADGKLTWTGATTNDLNGEVAGTVANYTFSSKAWNGVTAANVKVNVKLDGTNVVVTVVGAPTGSSFKSGS